MSAQDRSIHSATETYSAASIAADVDLVTVRGNYSTDGLEMYPKFIIVWDTGDLVLEYPNGQQDTIGITVPGVLIPCQPSKIINTGTTCEAFTVGYN